MHRFIETVLSGSTLATVVAGFVCAATPILLLEPIAAVLYAAIPVA